MILLHEAEFITVPWKNGGWTKEILKVAAADGSFDWRLSLATIEQPDRSPRSQASTAP